MSVFFLFLFVRGALLTGVVQGSARVCLRMLRFRHAFVLDLCVCVCVPVCIFTELCIIAQSGHVILVILCHSR